MLIDFRCTGGFANLNLSYSADTQTLPGNLGERLERAVQEANLSTVDSALGEGHGPPDVLTYEVSVEDRGRRNEIAVTDVTAPQSMRPLLELLQQLAIDEAP